MVVRFVHRANGELDEAIQYYATEFAGLGLEFLAEVAVAIGRIISHPEAWQQLESGVRRYKMKRFPFGLVYDQRGEDINVGKISLCLVSPT